MDLLRTAFEFVRDRIAFVRDPQRTELLQAPWVTLWRGRGDCDDKAILLAALPRAAGYGHPDSA